MLIRLKRIPLAVKAFRFSRHTVAAFFLFLLLLLLLCDRPFSFIYSSLHNEQSLGQEASERNNQRTDVALDYFRQVPKRSLQELQNISQPTNSSFSFVIVIITVSRKKNGDRTTGYLLQSAASLHSLLKADAFFTNSFLFVCNVDTSPKGHEDAALLKDYLPFVERYGSSTMPGMRDLPIPGTEQLYRNTKHSFSYDRERHDYNFCLQAASQFHSRYYLIFQDDAIPHPDFSDVLRLSLAKLSKRQLCLTSSSSIFSSLVPSYTSCLLDHPPYFSSISPQPPRTISPSPNSSFAYLKFYFPERWQGFAFEPLRLADLASLSAVGGGVALFAHALLTAVKRRQSFQPSWRVFFVGMSLALLMGHLVGRQNVNELRRLSKYFYRFQTAPSCCIPAMLYPAPVMPFLTTWLAESPDRSKVDLRISECFRYYEVPAYYIEPNIVRHVGMVTSLDKTYRKPVEEFLLFR